MSLARRPSLVRFVLTLGVIAALAPYALGSPGDPFSVALPGRDTAPPEGISSASAEASVGQQGAVSYSYPIAVPPGRNGMAPRLALNYSSNGALRGGLAVGWTLALPTIERDPLLPEAYRYAGELLTSSLGDFGTGTVWRPEIDRGGMVRLERTPSSWIARTPDGVTRTFTGDGQSRWNLASERDSFGNTVVYNWSPVAIPGGNVDFVLQSIDYGANGAAGITAHARLELSWSMSTCSGAVIPIGARLDGHFGLARMFGAQQLSSIKTRVRDVPSGSWRDVRRYLLKYDAAAMSCTSERPPLRYLVEIDELGDPAGAMLAAPPVKFQYGPQRALSTSYSTYATRLGEYGTERGPEGQLMDFDGDGINDQVRAAMPAAVSGGGCRLFVKRGTWGGLFLTETESWLPSAAWGGIGNSPLSQLDGCTLNGQFASRATFAYGGSSNGHCIESAVGIDYRFLDWDHDGDLDLVASTTVTSGAAPGGDFQTTASTEDDGDDQPQGGCPAGSSETGTTIEDGTTVHHCQCGAGTVPNGSGSGCESQCAAGTMWYPAEGTCGPSCEGFDGCSSGEWDPPGGEGPSGSPPAPGVNACSRDVLPGVGFHVFFNEGNRFHPSNFLTDGTPSRRYIESPVPLASNGSPLEVLPPNIAHPPGLPALVDIDGDGALDLITLDDEPYRDGGEHFLGTGGHLNVFRGQPDGMAFRPREQWNLPAWGLVTDRIIFTSSHPHIWSTAQAGQLTDVDGDGLPDLLVQVANANPDDPSLPQLHVSYNRDGRFSALQPLGVRSPVGQQRNEMPLGSNQGSTFGAGYHASSRTLTDVDRDGRLDLVTLVTDTSSGVLGQALTRTVVHIGDGATGGATLSAPFENVERLVRALNARAWFRMSDYVDITGDGRPDLVSFAANGAATYVTDAPGSAPERLLVSIDNGRGALTSFTYSASTDPMATEAGAGRRNEPRWLVRSMTVAPGAAQPPITSSYTYGQPVYGRETAGDVAPRFLGFTRSTVDRSGQQGPLSSRVVTDYGYTLDPGGYAVSTWTYLKRGRGLSPVSNATTTWSTSQLGNGQARFLRRDTQVMRTCDDGATVAECAVEAENVATERSIWNPFGPMGSALYVPAQTITEQPRPGGGIDQRITTRTFQVRIGQSPYAADDYRVLPASEERRATPTGAFLARTVTVYDAAGLPADSYVNTTASVADSAHTIRTFDSATGNVLTIKRPNAVAAASPKLVTLVYDANRLFVAQTRNELDQRINEFHDAGTGALVRREGPNKRTYPSYCTWPPCSMVTSYAPEEWTIDAFGRPTQHRIATEPTSATQGYGLQLVGQTSYNDGAVPNSRTSSVLGSTWIVATETYDGLGRVTLHRQAGPPVTDTTYFYDAAGGLLSIRSPDPRNDAATVTTAYARDGLGRVTSMSRPDGTVQQVAYRGLSVQAQDVAGQELGPASQVDHDPFGRLTVVHEPDGAGDHLTTYTYDAADRMTGIVDADGNATAMAYDRAGHRTSVIRGTRTWTYGYDANGNMTSVQAPVPSGGIASQYRSTTTYDEIDRTHVHTPASRGMDGPRMAALGIGSITTEYDTGVNGIGAPARVLLPFGAITYAYDVQSHVKRETRTLTLGHGVPGATTQYVDRAYNWMGAPVEVVFDDGTKWQTLYDARGMVDAVRWWSTPTSFQVVADYDRLLAGMPRGRSSNAGPRRDWTYDALGRVTRDRVWKLAALTTTTFADRTYGYDSFGRLAATVGTVNGQDAGADFDFDGRGRLTVAHVGTSYSASTAYSPAGNVTRAAVAGALDVPSRDVTYHYGDFDPQAVDRLTSADGSSWANLRYDLSGNLTRRQLPGGIWDITVDGDDQIREVSGPDGTETYYFGAGAERIASFGPEGVKLWFGESETRFNAVGGAQILRWYHLGAGEPLARVTKPATGSTTIELQYADTLQNLFLTLATTVSTPVTSSFLYGGFGEVVWQSGASNHRRQFNGKEADSTSGLRHYGYRSYDPVLLRWTAADPMYRFVPDAAWAEPQRANLYAFSLNNPMRYYDPDGRNPETGTCEAGDEQDPDVQADPPGASGGIEGKGFFVFSTTGRLADGQANARGTLSVVTAPAPSGSASALNLKVQAGGKGARASATFIDYKGSRPISDRLSLYWGVNILEVGENSEGKLEGSLGSVNGGVSVDLDVATVNVGVNVGANRRLGLDVGIRPADTGSRTTDMLLQFRPGTYGELTDVIPGYRAVTSVASDATYSARGVSNAYNMVNEAYVPITSGGTTCVTCAH